MHSMKDFWHLLLFTVRCRLKSEASTSYLSYGWWVIEPLLHMVMFYVIFSVLLNRGTENFVAYLLCGLIPWLWFSKSVGNSMNSISNAKSIMMQTRIPVVLFPAGVVAQDTVKQLFVFALLLLFLWIYGIAPSMHWIAIIPLAIVQLTLTFCISLLVAAMVPFLPDIRFLINTGLLMMMLGSGIFYSYEVILPQHRDVFFMNPMANLIKNYREILLYQHWPDWQAIGVMLAISLIIISILIKTLKSLNATYARITLES